MEVADNQHPIDLSRKCAYYEHPQRYTKSHVSSSSRPLPDLIPISLLQDTTKPLASFRKYYDDDRRSPFLNCMQSCNQSLLSFQSKQRSMTRKELSRQRSTSPATSIGTAFSSGFSSKIRKSNSETRIPFLRIDDSPLNRSSANYLSVPLHRKTMPSLLSTTVTRPSSKAVRNYDDQDAGPFHHVSDLCRRFLYIEGTELQADDSKVNRTCIVLAKRFDSTTVMTSTRNHRTHRPSDVRSAILQ